MASTLTKPKNVISADEADAFFADSEVIYTPDVVSAEDADSFFADSKPVAENSNKSFKYDVAPKPDTRTQASKLLQYGTEQAVLDKKAKRANSPLGTILNTVKGAGEMIASPEIGLGKSIGKIFSKGNLKTYTKNIDQMTSQQVQLSKLMREKEARGEDTESLKSSYNLLSETIDENKKHIEDYSKELPTKGKVIGQIGGTALDLVTAGSYGKAAQGAKTGKLFNKASTAVDKASTIIPEIKKVGEIANGATGIGTKKGLGKILKGGGVGYASDVTLGLAGDRGENREGAKAFIPGLGTAIGAGIPAVSEVSKTFNNKFTKSGKVDKLVTNRQHELGKLESYASIDKVVQKSKDKGFDVKDIVSQTDLLNKSVDKTGTISTKGEGEAVAQVQDFLNKNGEDVVNKILEKEGVTVNPAVLEAKLKKSVMSSGLQGSNLTKALKEIETDMAGYALRANKDGKIPLSVIHSAKVDKYSNINFMTDPSTQKTAKVIAKTLKEMVETGTSSVNVKAVNKELSKYYAVIDYLEKLDGKKVDGGKLGKYFSSTIGAMIGSPLGPLGTLGGAVLGEAYKGNKLQNTFGGKTGKVLESSQMMKDAITESNKPRLILPAPKTGAPRSSINSTSVIPILPSKSQMEFIGKNGVGNYFPKKKLQLSKDESLTGKDAEVQEASIRKYEQNASKLVNEYIAKNGNVINTDEARKLFKDTGYNGNNSSAVQEASSAVAKDAWRSLLKKSDTNENVLIFAGGSGTGKTTAVKNLFPDEIKNAGAVLDGNLSTVNSAKERLQEAIDAGKSPSIFYVYRDPVDSWVNGVVKRMKVNKEEEGRIVPLSVFLQNHQGSFNVVKSLMASAKHGSDYSVKLIDNSLGKGKEDLLSKEKFDNINYGDNLKEELSRKTKELYEKGHISKIQYEALIK